MLLSAGTGVVGGSLAARLTAYRIYLVPISVISLGAGFYLAYWKRRGPRWNRTVLWVATVVSVFLWLLPYLMPWLYRALRA